MKKPFITSKYTPYIAGAIGFLVCWVLFVPGGGHDHAAEQAAMQPGGEPAVWTCSMHPQIRQPNPGKCPICAMDLIPVVSSGSGSGEPRELEMSQAAMKMAEIETATVKREWKEYELRLTGKVEYDETRLKYITAWFPGRLDRLFVDYTGTPVKLGDHLAEIYSPSLLTDQESLLQALRAVKNSDGSSASQLLDSRREVLEKARERLRLLGLTAEQVREIEERGAPTDRITFHSPIDGVVIGKDAREGDYVETGTRIYTIADLSRVWVKLDTYESDIQWIHYGQEVEFTTVSYPGETFTGRIAFIDPFLNEMTRTVKVRVNVENPDGRLKPEMFVRANVHARVNSKGEIYDSLLAGKWISPMHPEIIKEGPGECDICGMALVQAEELGYINPAKNDKPPLVIPVSAPLITGTRAVVYVKKPDTEQPLFEGREIVLGPRLKDHYIVQDGLSEGEEIVTNGNFKIDSSLQILAKPSMMNPQESDTENGSTQEKITDQNETGKPPETNIPSHALGDLLIPYRAMTEALVNSDLAAAQKASNAWVEAAKQHSLPEVEMLGHSVMHTQDIEEARTAFEAISDALIASVKESNSPKEPLYVAFCPMAFKNKGAHWLQWNNEIMNPYFGSRMLRCGTIQETIAANEHTPGDGHQH